MVKLKQFVQAKINEATGVTVSDDITFLFRDEMFEYCIVRTNKLSQSGSRLLKVLYQVVYHIPIYSGGVSNDIQEGMNRFVEKLLSLRNQTFEVMLDELNIQKAQIEFEFPNVTFSEKERESYGFDGYVVADVLVNIAY